MVADRRRRTNGKLKREKNITDYVGMIFAEKEMIYRGYYYIVCNGILSLIV